MAIDPSIVLGLRPPQIPTPEIQTPLERFGKLLTLQNLMRQGQMGDIQLQQARQEMAATEAINRALAGDLSSPATGPEGRAQPLPYQPNESGPPTAQPLPYAPNVSGPPTAQPLTDLSALGPRLLRAGGKYALPIVKSLNETQKSILEQQLKALDLQQGKVKDMATIASGITDESSKLAGIATAFSKGYIDVPTRDRLLSHPYNPKDYEVFQNQALDANQRLEQARASVKQQWEAHDQAQKDRQENLLNAWQDLQTVTDTSGVPAWFARQPKDVQQLLGGVTGLQDLNQIKMIVGSAAQKPAAGTTTPYPAAVQEQKVETQAVQGLRAKELELALQNKNNAQIIDLVKADPTGRLFSQLPPEVQKQITAELARGGYTAFTKEPTTPEQRALTFYQRASDASKVLTELESKIQDKNFLAQAVFQYGPNWMQSEANQGYRQAQRQFTEARLRKESGAAIAPSEYENDAKTYFPQPGDSKATMAQKAKAREDILGALRVEAGNAYRQQYPESQAPAQKPATAETKPAPTAPTKAAPPKPGAILPGKDGKRWMFIGGDPRDRNNYKEWHPEAQ